MKNFFKLGFVALALSLSVVACNSEKTGESTDSPAVAMDSPTVAMDSPAMDSPTVNVDTPAVAK